MTIESTTAQRGLILAIATTLGCAGYLEESDALEPQCDDIDPQCHDAPGRDVLVVPDAVSPPATERSRGDVVDESKSRICPPGTREVHEPEGSCGAVVCDPLPKR